MISVSSYLFGKPGIYFRDNDNNPKKLLEVGNEIAEDLAKIAKNIEIMDKNGWTNQFQMYDIEFGHKKWSELPKEEIEKHLKEIGVDMSVISLNNYMEEDLN